MGEGGVEGFHEILDDGLGFDGVHEFGGDALGGGGVVGGLGVGGVGAEGGGVGIFFDEADGDADVEVGDGAEGFFEFDAGFFVGEVFLGEGESDEGFAGVTVEAFELAAVAEDAFEIAGGRFEVAASGGPDGGEVVEIGDFFDGRRSGLLDRRIVHGSGAAGGALLFLLGVFRVLFFLFTEHGLLHNFIDGFFGSVGGVLSREA